MRRMVKESQRTPCIQHDLMLRIPPSWFAFSRSSVWRFSKIQEIYNIDRLLIIWKSYLSDKIKKRFLPCSGCVNTTVRMHQVDANKTHGEKARWELRKNATSYFERIPKATPHITTSIRPLTSHLKNHPSKTNQTRGTMLEKHGRTHKVL